MQSCARHHCLSNVLSINHWQSGVGCCFWFHAGWSRSGPISAHLLISSVRLPTCQRVCLTPIQSVRILAWASTSPSFLRGSVRALMRVSARPACASADASVCLFTPWSISVSPSARSLPHPSHCSNRVYSGVSYASIRRVFFQVWISTVRIMYWSVKLR